jgi:hypothetical protein
VQKDLIKTAKVILPCAQEHYLSFGVKLYCCILASKTNKKYFLPKSEDQLGLKVTEKALPNGPSDPSIPSMLISCGIEIEPRLHCRPRKKQKQLPEGKDLNKESEAGKKERWG